jgi:hypothetical protein
MGFKVEMENESGAFKINLLFKDVLFKDDIQSHE